MKKGFSLINIVVFFCGIAFVFLLYDKYYKPKTINEDLYETNIASSSATQNNATTSSLVQTNVASTVQTQNRPESQQTIKPPRTATTSWETPADEGGNALPDLNTLPEERQVTETTPQPTEPVIPTTDNGYYENFAYNYSLTCPTDWPLKIQGADNVSIGTVPPKNGQGAITIEVTTDNVTGEINAAEAQAKKYPGVITLTKEKITIDGVTGDKLIMLNSLVNTTNIYIFLQKNNLNYSIKYAHESSQFTADAEKAVKTFKFTK